MNNPISLLIIGLVVSFGTGFLVGHVSQPEIVSPYPVNYNPQAAQASEATKAAQESVRQCYTLLGEQLLQIKAQIAQLQHPETSSTAH